MMIGEFRKAASAFGVLSLLIAAACVSDGGSSSGAVIAGSGDAGSGDAGSGDCDPATEKLCGGICVRKDDPSYGCTVDKCEGCAERDFVTQFRCEGTTCKVQECVPGRFECNTNATDGCEEKVNGKNCGKCGISCTGTDVCSEVAPDGGMPDDAGASPKYACTATCRRGLEACDGACVDLTSDEANCGACGVQCKANRTKGTASCDNRVCVQSCLTGMKLNATGTECVADRANCIEGGRLSVATYSEQCCSGKLTPGFNSTVCTTCNKLGEACSRGTCCSGSICSTTTKKCILPVISPQ
jgi:hypothetical protein